MWKAHSELNKTRRKTLSDKCMKEILTELKSLSKKKSLKFIFIWFEIETEQSNVHRKFVVF